MLRVGDDRFRLLLAVVLLRNIGWATLGAEQGHMGEELIRAPHVPVRAHLIADVLEEGAAGAALFDVEHGATCSQLIELSIEHAGEILEELGV